VDEVTDDHGPGRRRRSRSRAAPGIIGSTELTVKREADPRGRGVAYGSGSDGRSRTTTQNSTCLIMPRAGLPAVGVTSRGARSRQTGRSCPPRWFVVPSPRRLPTAWLNSLTPSQAPAGARRPARIRPRRRRWHRPARPISTAGRPQPAPQGRAPRNGHRVVDVSA
jgi:hypothetical protein